MKLVVSSDGVIGVMRLSSVGSEVQIQGKNLNAEMLEGYKVRGNIVEFRGVKVQLAVLIEAYQLLKIMTGSEFADIAQKVKYYRLTKLDGEIIGLGMFYDNIFVVVAPLIEESFDKPIPRVVIR